MIGEFVVRPRQLDPWHVARYAVIFGDRTAFRARLCRDRLCRGILPAAMAGQTPCVEVYLLGAEVVVRVVASEAANARIIRVVAFAAGQAVRLKADIGDPGVSQRNHFRPGSVTLAAKVGCLVRGEPNQPMQVFWHSRLGFAGLHRGEMRLD